MTRHYYESCYLTMRDGVRIAIDIWRPASQSSLAPQVPTMLRQTRYFRSYQLRRPFRWLNGNRPIDLTGLYGRRRKKFLAAGYAWVDVDVRGSGASSGFRISPWSQPEVADTKEIIDWIVAQPWSDGTLGILGISYDGTAAEMALTTGHPAIKAIAPEFSSCDSFSDIGFPGGLKNAGFAQRWQRMNSALDANRLQDLAGIAGVLATVLTSGVAPVSSDHDDQLRAAAIADHRGNYQVMDRLREITFADDEVSDERAPTVEVVGESGARLKGTQLVSPSQYAQAIIDTDVPIYNVSGWWDGSYARVAALRFHRTPNSGSCLLLGPWNHGGLRQLEPGGHSVTSRFDHDQRLLDFFNLHLRGQTNELANEPPVRYFTMGQSKWKFSPSWPPAESQLAVLFLNRGGTLHPHIPETEPQTQADSLYQRTATTTGISNRWQTQAMVNGVVQYPNQQRSCEGRLCFRTPPLPIDTEVTGHPIVEFQIAVDASDGTLLVYLQDVEPSEKIWMVSEGMLRLIHRRIQPSSDQRNSIAHDRLGIPFRTYCRADAQSMPAVGDGQQPDGSNFVHVRLDLLPTSHLFRAGHRIQISIAMADVGNFAETEATRLWLRCGALGSESSRLEIPTISTCTHAESVSF